MRSLGVVLVLLALSACSSDPAQERLNNYRERLARALKQDPIPVTLPSLPPLPERRALRIEVSDSRINLLDFLKLFRCELSQVVGQKNSSLGKVARASQQLFMGLDFLRIAPLCIETLQDLGDDALADKLQQAWRHKRQQLPQLIWHATLAGPEFQKFWHLPLQLGHYPQQVSSVVPEALEQLQQAVARWLSGDYAYDASQIEHYLYHIQTGRGGALLQSSHWLSSHLHSANQTLHARQQGNPLCYRQTASPQGRILLNVVQKFFIADVQVWAADLSRRYYQLLPPIHRLERDLAVVMPEAYQHWRHQRDQQLLQLIQSPKAHVTAVQPLLRACGLLPQP